LKPAKVEEIINHILVGAAMSSGINQPLKQPEVQGKISTTSWLKG
jgi:hypothetical protein